VERPPSLLKNLKIIVEKIRVVVSIVVGREAPTRSEQAQGKRGLSQRRSGMGGGNKQAQGYKINRISNDSARNPPTESSASMQARVFCKRRER
jgi:hypothetical protein